jgi:diaminohydroxyphosphoribosylaminopyrimidine deaminase/5-amino-6-(5-phosphoribosylamino)uracil reductase
VKQVIVGMRDPNPLTNGKSILKLRRAGISTRVGVLQEDCERVNEPFIKYIKRRLPFVVAKCAQTLDGKVATATGQSQWITSSQTRDFARRRRDEFDAILVGIQTVLKDNPSLDGVKRIRRIKKIIVDSRLQIPFNARLFTDTRPEDCLIATTRLAIKTKISRLEQKGVRVLVCPLRQGRVNLTWLFQQLAKQEITSVLIEGGARIIGSAIHEQLVDKMHVYIAPKIIGDQKALSSMVGLDITNVNRAVSLNIHDVQRIGKDILIEAYVHRNH